jgi:hypothetical protein
MFDTRQRVVSLGPSATWGARVYVDELEPFAGRPESFEVVAEWVGPPQTGFPPDPQPGFRRDSYGLPTLGQARHVAQLAFDELRNARVPDLRALARRLG